MTGFLIPLSASIDLFSSTYFELWSQLFTGQGLVLDPAHDLLDFIESSHVVPSQDDVEFNGLVQLWFSNIQIVRGTLIGHLIEAVLLDNNNKLSNDDNVVKDDGIGDGKALKDEGLGEDEAVEDTDDPRDDEDVTEDVDNLGDDDNVTDH